MKNSRIRLLRVLFILTMIVGFWINSFTSFFSTILYLLSLALVKPILWIIHGKNQIIEEKFSDFIEWCYSVDKRIHETID